MVRVVAYCVQYETMEGALLKLSSSDLKKLKWQKRIFKLNSSVNKDPFLTWCVQSVLPCP